MKRKRCDSDSDPAEDEDFVPDDFEEEEEELEEDDNNTEDLDLDFRTPGKSQSSNRTFVSSSGGNSGNSSCDSDLLSPQASGYLKSSNGLSANTMRTVWEAIETTKKL